MVNLGKPGPVVSGIAREAGLPVRDFHEQIVAAVNLPHRRDVELRDALGRQVRVRVFNPRLDEIERGFDPLRVSLGTMISSLLCR